MRLFYYRNGFINQLLCIHHQKNGHVKLDPCTNEQWDGCERKATRERIINPVRSARLRSINGFSFRYGRAEIVAKLPSGDWLWPALWMLPTSSKYGVWPRSGEIDIVESRGNLDYVGENDKQIGPEQITSTLHFGPSWDRNGYQTSTFSTNRPRNDGFNKEVSKDGNAIQNSNSYIFLSDCFQFHKFQMEWTDQYIKFSIDDVETGNVPVGDGFWARGKFTDDNIWAAATKAAPFDEEVSRESSENQSLHFIFINFVFHCFQFHFVLNLAVGGTNYFFPDNGNRNGEKPWRNSAPSTALTDFWNRRSQWLPSWKLNENNGESASLIIDSIKVWAI